METKTIEPRPGELLYDVIAKAVEVAHDGCNVDFAFNGRHITVSHGESFSQAHARIEAEVGHSILDREAIAEQARENLERREREYERARVAANALTEQELRDADVPWVDSEQELVAYIAALVDRPHDYGTCVYAMSMAATAALRYVARRLGTTGFQASCADMDILRRTRGLEFGRVVNYENLLYPQYLDAEHFPGWRDLLESPEVRGHLKAMAEKKLSSTNGGHPNVVEHWRRLAAWGDSPQPTRGEG